MRARVRRAFSGSASSGRERALARPGILSFDTTRRQGRIRADAMLRRSSGRARAQPRAAPTAGETQPGRCRARQRHPFVPVPCRPARSRARRRRNEQPLSRRARYRRDAMSARRRTRLGSLRIARDRAHRIPRSRRARVLRAHRAAPIRARTRGKDDGIARPASAQKRTCGLLLRREDGGGDAKVLPPARPQLLHLPVDGDEPQRIQIASADQTGGIRCR